MSARGCSLEGRVLDVNRTRARMISTHCSMLRLLVIVADVDIDGV